MSSIWTMGEILVEIMRPRAGIPLHEPAEFLGPYPSGAPAIFIDTVARLGHSCGIVGGVGDDGFGHCVVDRLKADGVNCDHVLLIPNRSTAVAFVTYFDDGSRQFIFHVDGTPAVMADALPPGSVADPAYFHIMGCSLMANDEFREQILDTMESFHNQGARISFDPNIRPELLGDRGLDETVGQVMERCSILFPGKAELEMLTGCSGVKSGVLQLFDTHPLEIIVVKRGEQGCTVYTRSQVIDIAAYAVEEVDPTGAGDCFDGAFLCGLLESRSLLECGQMASAAGALNAAAFGPMEGNTSRETVWGLITRGP
jgi:sugar/nucleoside kinase (ribokinase family)